MILWYIKSVATERARLKSISDDKKNVPIIIDYVESNFRGTNSGRDIDFDLVNDDKKRIRKNLYYKCWIWNWIANWLNRLKKML